MPCDTAHRNKRCKSNPASSSRDGEAYATNLNTTEDMCVQKDDCALALNLAPNLHMINGAGKPNKRPTKAVAVFPQP